MLPQDSPWQRATTRIPITLFEFFDLYRIRLLGYNVKSSIP